ncbi:MAG: NAD(+)/NADH kinase [Oscillospiraceae bacterium]|jgi:NAD+ kinase|nr:NAD(+)/NADH kinase [Oscillospiraceae bacterium]
MKRIAVVWNEKKPDALALAQAVCAQLAQVGLQAHMLALASFNEAALAACDALLAVGGDGTILHAVHQALPLQKPVLGLNGGRLGFLAGLEQDELPLLARLRTEEFALDRRMLLEARVLADTRCVARALCLNDAVISRSKAVGVAELPVECGGHRLEYRGDGVIFATPTGSTAYNFSAGGPVVDPKVEGVLLTPICNHLLFSRSLFFAAQSRFVVEIPQEGLALTCDAEPSLALFGGQRVEIRRAAEEACFIRLKENHFLDVLSGKMMARRI